MFRKRRFLCSRSRCFLLLVHITRATSPDSTRSQALVFADVSAKQRIQMSQLYASDNTETNNINIDENNE